MWSEFGPPLWVMTEQGSQAGWYPDHQDPARLRYFDGRVWTDQRSESTPYGLHHPTAGAGMGPLAYWQYAIIENNHSFRGRARRAEFWWTMTISGVALWSVSAFAAAMRDPELIVILSIMYAGLLVPSLAVTARRLHDTGRTGWWILIAYVPLLGVVLLLVFLLTDGDRGPNKYGPSPKYT